MKYDNNVYRSLAMITQLGISVLAPVLGGTFLGVFLEKKIAFPFTMIFLILGILAGGRNAYVLAKKIIESPKDKGDSDE